MRDNLRQFNLRSAVDLGMLVLNWLRFCIPQNSLLSSKVTGSGVVARSLLAGGWIHVIPRGGKFDVHVDRNLAIRLGWFGVFPPDLLEQGWKASTVAIGIVEQR